MTECKRCKQQFEETSFQRSSRAIMDSAPLCPECKKAWQEERKRRGWSNTRYVRASDLIDW